MNKPTLPKINKAPRKLIDWGEPGALKPSIILIADELKASHRNIPSF